MAGRRPNRGFRAPQDLQDQIVLTGRLIVPEGEAVDAAVIFDGDALVEGTDGLSLAAQ